jgi:hypothetical protein
MPIFGIGGVGNFGTIAAKNLLGNSDAIAANVSAIAISANLSLSAAGTLDIATGAILQAATTAPVVVQGNASVPATGDALFHIVGKDGIFARQYITAYGAASIWTGRSSGGTQATPLASAADNNLAIFGGRGYGATAFTSANRATIAFVAAEAWSDTAQGTYINFSVTLNGGTVTSIAARLQNSGILTIGTTVVAGANKLQVTGGVLADFITVGVSAGPKVLQGAGAPSATAPSGSIYLRNDGSAGAQVYINQDGVSSWSAINWLSPRGTVTATTTGTIAAANIDACLVNIGSTATTLTVGSGIDGQKLRLDILQGVTAHTVAFDATVRFGTDILSYTAGTVAAKTDHVQLINNGGSVWDFVGVAHGY